MEWPQTLANLGKINADPEKPSVPKELPRNELELIPRGSFGFLFREIPQKLPAFRKTSPEMSLR